MILVKSVKSITKFKVDILNSVQFQKTFGVK